MDNQEASQSSTDTQHQNGDKNSGRRRESIASEDSQTAKEYVINSLSFLTNYRDNRTSLDGIK